MIGAVETLVAERLSAVDAARFEGRVAFADVLPFADGSFDAAMSSFVLQLVPSRARALREIGLFLRAQARVLRRHLPLAFEVALELVLAREVLHRPVGADAAGVADLGGLEQRPGRVREVRKVMP